MKVLVLFIICFQMISGFAIGQIVTRSPKIFDMPGGNYIACLKVDPKTGLRFLVAYDDSPNRGFWYTDPRFGTLEYQFARLIYKLKPDLSDTVGVSKIITQWDTEITPIGYNNGVIFMTEPYPQMQPMLLFRRYSAATGARLSSYSDGSRKYLPHSFCGSGSKAFSGGGVESGLPASVNSGFEVRAYGETNHAWTKTYTWSQNNGCTHVTPYGKNCIIASGYAQQMAVSVILDTNGKEIAQYYWESNPWNMRVEEVTVLPSADRDKLIVIAKTYDAASSPATYVGVHGLDGTKHWGVYGIGWPSTNTALAYSDSTFGVLIGTRYYTYHIGSSNSMSSVRGIISPYGYEHLGGDSIVAYGSAPAINPRFGNREDMGLQIFKGVGGKFDPTSLNTQLTQLADVKSKLGTRLVPNPAHGSVVIEGLTELSQAVTIINSMGQVVKQTTASETQSLVGLEGLSPGLYTVLVGKQRHRLVIE